MSNLSASQEFKGRIDVLKANGLKDIKFYPGEVGNALPEDFCAEANRMLEAVERDEGNSFSFGDSRKK